MAQLFAKAGDNAHALDQFQRALRLAPENGEALAGAGQAAFQLGDYALARTYLRRAPAEADEVVRHAGDRGPGAVQRSAGQSPRLGRAAPTAVADLLLRAPTLERVPRAGRGGQPTDDALALQSEAQAFEDQLKPPAALEQDTVETGVDLIDRIERLVRSALRAADGARSGAGPHRTPARS